MAILDDFCGVKVEILVNGHPLNEHDLLDPRTEPHEVTKFVEAQSRDEFAIRVMFTAPFPKQQPLAIRLTVDGKKIERIYYNLHNILEPGGFVFEGFRTKVGSPKFRFKELNNTETPGHIGRSKSLGLIAVSLQCVDIASRRKARRPQPLPSSRNVNDGPRGKVIFKYRTRKDLQALGVIPQDAWSTTITVRPAQENPPESRAAVTGQSQTQIAAIDTGPATEEPAGPVDMWANEGLEITGVRRLARALGSPENPMVID